MSQGYGYFEEDHLGEIRDRHLWGRILRFVAPHRARVAGAVALSLCITGVGLALPRILQLGIDRFIMNGALPQEARLSGLSGLGLLFFGVMLLGFCANFLQVLVLETAGQRIMHALRQALFTHIVRLDLPFFTKNPTGKLTTRLTNDIQNMHEMFTSVIVTIFNDAAQLLGVAVILGFLDWRLALVLSVMAPLLALLSAVFARLARDAFREIRTRLARINAFLQEAVSGLSVIQVFGRERDTGERYLALTDAYSRATFRQITLFGVIMPLIEVLSSVTLAVIIWYGGGEHVQGRMTLGTLVAFISYTRLFFQPLRELSQKYSIVQSAMASAERIFELLDTPADLPLPAAPARIEAVRGEVEFRGVTFGYEPGRPVLMNLTLRAAPGETVAVVGATGAGKTTLISLLERFHDPWEGAVLLDGVDVRRLDPARLRREIGLVMQDVFIVPGTLRENIVLDGDVTGAALSRIVAAAQLSGVVSRVGLEGRVGEGGTDLSAGERQLLAFARVLARDPRILVLDEATASVDTETEMRIEEAVAAALSGRTSIVIAHRLSTIRRADRIVVMEAGRIIEEGRHEELMARDGAYRHLQMLGALPNGRSAAA